MEQFQEAFSNIKKSYDSNPARDPDIVCKHAASGCLKLQKASWTNPGMLYIPSNIGIFFSVWQSGKGAANNQLDYNIHALKLRRLSEYSITSINFARQFRDEFAGLCSSWPNVGIEHGPLTLMQGWIPLDMSTVEHDVAVLFEKFLPVSVIIDRMLAQRIKAFRKSALASA